MTRLIGFVSLLTLLALPTAAQQDSPAFYTEARQHEIRRSVQLPGSVESLTSSVVAAETQGSVVKMEVRPGDRVEAGTPWLKDIPLLGWLFRSTRTVDLDVSLLVVVRAEIHRPEAAALSDQSPPLNWLRDASSSKKMISLKVWPPIWRPIEPDVMVVRPAGAPPLFGDVELSRGP